MVILGFTPTLHVIIKRINIYKTKKYLKAQIFSLVKRGGLAIATLLMVASCDMWHTDTDDCPIGVYVKFKYDYNLQRADMFNDHVGAVTLYVYDENGNFVKKFEEANSLSAQPLKNVDY